MALREETDKNWRPMGEEAKHMEESRAAPKSPLWVLVRRGIGRGQEVRTSSQEPEACLDRLGLRNLRDSQAPRSRSQSHIG